MLLLRKSVIRTKSFASISILRRIAYHNGTNKIMVKVDEGRFEHLIFVYGTLKRNQPNNATMMNSANGLAHFVATARTVERFPLVIASQFNIPFLLGKNDTGNQIDGELYSVDDRMLAFLDAFEGHPDYYIRQRRAVIRTDVGATDQNEPLRPWIYILERYKSDMLKLPMYSTYDSYGSHGLRYVERFARQGENANCGHTEKAEVLTTFSSSSF